MRLTALSQRDEGSRQVCSSQQLLVSLDAEGVKVAVGDVWNADDTRGRAQPDISLNVLFGLLDQCSRGTSRMIAGCSFSRLTGASQRSE